MKIRFSCLVFLPLLILGIAVQVSGQAPVVASSNPESLFTSPDPALNANKQVVLHIVRDLLEANHWSEADQYLSERYLQHNPQVASGLAPVQKFFAGRPAQPIPAKMQTKVVSVVAEGDLVVVAVRQEFANPKKAGECYTTTWFDMWRIVNGKADEHWDEARIGEPAPAACH